MKYSKQSQLVIELINMDQNKLMNRKIQRKESLVSLTKVTKNKDIEVKTQVTFPRSSLALILIHYTCEEILAKITTPVDSIETQSHLMYSVAPTQHIKLD